MLRNDHLMSWCGLQRGSMSLVLEEACMLPGCSCGSIPQPLPKITLLFFSSKSPIPLHPRQFIFDYLILEIASIGSSVAARRQFFAKYLSFAVRQLCQEPLHSSSESRAGLAQKKCARHAKGSVRHTLIADSQSSETRRTLA